MSRKSSREFDIAIFGATGFTGEYICRHFAEQYRGKLNEAPRVAIAGRDESRLRALQQRIGLPDSVAKVVVADISQPDTLRALCKRSRLLLNCVGPYRFFGEQVVSACLEESTDYADITGEGEFMERMVVKYHDEAVRKNVLFVSAAGFDCMAADLGVMHNIRQFGADKPHAVRGYLTGTTPGGMNHTTWVTFIYSLANHDNLRRLRATASTASAPASRTSAVPNVKMPGVHYHKELKAWALPFPTADATVVRRSQKLLSEQGQSFRYGNYLLVQRLWKVLACAIVLLFVKMLIKFQWGVKFLVNHHPFFLARGPTPEQAAASEFIFTFEGQSKTRRVVTRERGGEPGYAGSAIYILALSDILLNHRDSLAIQGGMVTPACFGEELLRRVQADGIDFTVVSK
eukprot:TRINITY_DN5232_c0_g2_i1.p1 TRINITY_DN5232_c0_g2~~TRINITY_DN5232_c0_g2_i1.p1  ORF type:complete len:402 (+),score=73.19 TRINITY_DN5232_c0_g2_i1:170-1375(+)